MLTDADGRVPAYWWHEYPNFGDLLTPWLIRKITGRDVVLADRRQPHYVVIGSILAYVTPNATVWGTGSFGIESKEQIQPRAKYLAVRGPLTRNKLRIHGVDCPAVYGDPALLVPEYYWPQVSIDHELGVVFRHAETKSFKAFDVPGVKKIYLRNEDVEGTIRDILSCRRVATTSLHGLILADAYGIPSAWFESGSPYGLDFKYWDYFLSVGKIRDPQGLAPIDEAWSLGRILNEVHFDSRRIKLNLAPLRGACPFIKK